MAHPRVRSLTGAYALLAFALFLQSTAAGMTQMAVYGSLVSMSGDKMLFGIAFSASILPGLVLGIYADRLAALHKSHAVLLGVGAAVLGAVLATLALGLERNLPLLIALEAVSAAAAVMTVPVFQFATKEVTEKAMSLERALKIETFVLSGSVIFGVGFGALFFDALGAAFYLKVVAIMFALSLLLVIFSRHVGPPLYDYESVSSGSLLAGLQFIHATLKENQEKRWVFLFLPSLALFTTPLIAALPAIDEVRQENIELGGVIIPFSLALLFMRSLGQLLGPLFVNREILETLSRREGAVVFLIGTFFMLYVVGFMSGTESVSCMAIFVAHLCTNILWAKNYCDMQTRFSKAEIGLASATQAQTAQVIMIAGSLAGTAALDGYGLEGLLMVCCIFLAAPVFSALRRKR